MIREALPNDSPTLVSLAADTGVFKPLEIVALEEVLDDYHAEEREAGHRCMVWQEGDEILGFVYHAPEPMTENTWTLWWIVVRHSLHGKGVGSRLLGYVEDDVRGLSGRVLFVETSSLPHYDPTRRFYLKHGYGIAGTLNDYYAPGDDMVVFRKVLAEGDQVICAGQGEGNS